MDVFVTENLRLPGIKGDARNIVVICGEIYF